MICPSACSLGASFLLSDEENDLYAAKTTSEGGTTSVLLYSHHGTVSYSANDQNLFISFDPTCDTGHLGESRSRR